MAVATWVLLVAVTVAAVGLRRIARSQPRHPARNQRPRPSQARTIGDEAELWLRDQARQAAGPADRRRRSSSWRSWFEGTGPFLWPAAYLATLGGLFFLASLYSPGELADVTVAVPLGLALLMVIAGFRYKRRRRKKIQALNGFSDDVVQRLLDRQRRGDSGR